MNNLAFFSIVINFLLGVQTQLTVQLQSDLSDSLNPKVVLQPQVLEIKKEVTGNTFELLTSTTDRVDGICSFDQGGKLESGRAFVFDQVSIGYATNAASGLEGNIEYDTKAPKELQNAIVIVKQDTREVLRMPFRDLHNISRAYSTNGNDAYSQLKALCFLADNKKVEITVKLAEGVSLPTDVKHYVWLRFNGLQTAKKA